MPIIEVKDLYKRYGDDAAAVDGVPFAVQRGEIFGILGPNGAGKTTVESIAGLRMLDSGSVTVLGLDPHRQKQPGGLGAAHRRSRPE